MVHVLDRDQLIENAFFMHYYCLLCEAILLISLTPGQHTKHMHFAYMQRFNFVVAYHHLVWSYAAAMSYNLCLLEICFAEAEGFMLFNFIFFVKNVH